MLHNDVLQIEENENSLTNSKANMKKTSKKKKKHKRNLNQTIKKFNAKITGPNHYMSLSTQNVNGLKSSIKRHRLVD